MQRAALHKLALAIAIAAIAFASVAIKVSIGPADREQVIGRSIEGARTATIAQLETHGFAISERGPVDTPIMHASNGVCTLTIVFGDPRGFHRATVDRLTSTTDRQRTFYAGRTYDELPVNRSWLGYYWWATLAEIGYVARYPLVQHVIIRPGCHDRSALLSELRRITAGHG